MNTNIFKNITIKKANIITITSIFVVSLIFVMLLVYDIYHDYKLELQESFGNSTVLVEEKQIQEEKLKSILIKTVLVIVTLAFIIFAIALGFYKILGTLLQNDTEAFLRFFDEAYSNNEKLDKDEIFFKEFKILSGYANKMVCTINEQKDELTILNQGLEGKVEEKTQKLKEVLESQKQFLRYTVHETNTPLSVILASIELYTMKHPKDRQLLKIEAAVKNIFSIYDDLSYLVKKDQVDYPKAVISFGEYIRSRVDFFTDVAFMSKVSFIYTPPKNDLHIYFNKTKLQRIVDNTITNAIKYTLADEVVYIMLEPIGTNIEFSVASRSKAIKDIDKVFEGFYREDNNRDGFGLGLQMVRAICDEEGVEVKVSSNESKTVFTYMFKMMGD
jgi:signal transduction histidine kinase